MIRPAPDSGAETVHDALTEIIDDIRPRDGRERGIRTGFHAEYRHSGMGDTIRGHVIPDANHGASGMYNRLEGHATRRRAMRERVVYTSTLIDVNVPVTIWFPQERQWHFTSDDERWRAVGMKAEYPLLLDSANGLLHVISTGTPHTVYVLTVNESGMTDDHLPSIRSVRVYVDHPDECQPIDREHALMCERIMRECKPRPYGLITLDRNTAG